MVLVEELATALQVNPVPHPPSPAHAAVQRLPALLETQRLPGAPQSEFTEQVLPKFSGRAYGTSCGLSSIPCMP
jgi:hypothetical protein